VQNIHFIAIGGAAMHNLALALVNQGFSITGSDDEIYEPSKSRLNYAGILPKDFGWFPEKITANLHAVILGMHARIDNPELIRAQQLGLKIYSYPEFLYEQTKNKKRVVIGGSHGKTTVTSMIMHVLKTQKIGFDYLVGSQLQGFERMAHIDEKNSIAVFEGDEYLASPIDRRPKFHLYKANIALITGIAWDHINVFPTYDNYVEQFRIFARELSSSDSLLYCKNDPELVKMVETTTIVANKIPYSIPINKVNEDSITEIIVNSNTYKLNVFGDHNLMNLQGAQKVCAVLGISDDDFYKAIQTFSGAARRLELIHKANNFIAYRDFAHSPSKLKATTSAIKNQYKKYKIIACMELHTFSSLNENFLNEYDNSFNDPDIAVVYFNPATIAHKKLKPITESQVKKAFGRQDLKVITDTLGFTEFLKSLDYNNSCLLLMSSGTFDGTDFKKMFADLKL
jgi:UDP-N-acetylmuramate: L-alanyl-gamma-D-glutamyl-meso-diaminopimelate ligase